jgi:putative oxidoreductase
MIAMDFALLILRIVVGLYVAAHGAQKLFGWFNGPGIKGAEGFLGGMLGFRPAAFWTYAVSLAEFGGGLLMVVGLFNPIGPIAIIAGQATATLVVHWAKGPWGAEGGYEQTLTNIAVAAAVAFAGAGRYSLDRLFGISIPAWFSVTFAIITLVVVVVGIGTRKVAPAPTTSPQTA